MNIDYLKKALSRFERNPPVLIRTFDPDKVWKVAKIQATEKSGVILVCGTKDEPYFKTAEDILKILEDIGEDEKISVFNPFGRITETLYISDVYMNKKDRVILSVER